MKPLTDLRSKRHYQNSRDFGVGLGWTRDKSHAARPAPLVMDAAHLPNAVAKWVSFVATEHAARTMGLFHVTTAGVVKKDLCVTMGVAAFGQRKWKLSLFIDKTSQNNSWVYTLLRQHSPRVHLSLMLEQSSANRRQSPTLCRASLYSQSPTQIQLPQFSRSR
jgi:hypothetical protein